MSLCTKYQSRPSVPSTTKYHAMAVWEEPDWGDPGRANMPWILEIDGALERPVLELHFGILSSKLSSLVETQHPEHCILSVTLPCLCSPCYRNQAISSQRVKKVNGASESLS